MAAGPMSPGRMAGSGAGFQERRGDVPQAFHCGGLGEQRLVAEHGVQEEPLVALEGVGGAEGAVVAEDHLCGAQVHRGAGFLGQEAGGDGAGVGEVDGDLVAPPVRGVWAVDREHPQRRLVEAECHYLAAGGEVFAGAQEERDPGPPPVVDLGPHRGQGFGAGARCHAGLVAVARILAADHMPYVDRLERVEDLGRLVAQVPGIQRGRRLHGHKAQDLEQVGDDHVPVGAGVVVEVGASFDRERLGHVDLHVGDVLAVPDRFEQAVGEPEGQDVVDRLLAEEVVDPEDL
jgi:hypothetical protein